MKSKILYVCLGVSVLLSIILCIYIVKYDAECERVHLDVINRDFDKVSETEGAKKIAAAYLGLEEDWELKENPIYDVEVIFNESGYEWIVIFSPKSSESDKERVVGIRKDRGIITEYDSRDKALDSEEAADPIIMRVAGWNMEYTPIDRKLTVEDFEAVELGISEQDVKDKIGEPNGYIAKELGIGHWVYVLEDGRAVGLAFNDSKLDYIMLFEGDNIVDYVKIELEPNQVRVDGMILDCPPEERFTIEDFDDVELGDTYSDMVEKVGKGNYDVGFSNSGDWINPIYILEDGKSVIAYFIDGYDLYKLVVFDGDDQDYVLKSTDENDIK